MRKIIVLDDSPIHAWILQYLFPDSTVEFKNIASIVDDDLPEFVTHQRVVAHANKIILFTSKPKIKEYSRNLDIDLCLPPMLDLKKVASQLASALQIENEHE